MSVANSQRFSSLSDIRVAMLCDNEFVMDKRIYREARALTDAGYNLTLFAVQGQNLADDEVLDGIRVKRVFDNRLFYLKSSLTYLKEAAEIIANYQPHIIHCHDWLMLHIGVLVKKKNPLVKLIYDSHELFHSWPLHYSSLSLNIVVKSWLVRRFEVLREWLDSFYIDHIITVSQSIAHHLQRYLNARNKVTLVRNFAEYEEISERKDFVRNKFNIPADHKIVVLFAFLIYRKKRNIEQVIAELGNKPGVSFVIFCKDGGHKNYFIELVRNAGYNNIYFHEAISADKIVNYLASCDVGVIPTWNKKYLSYWMGLENKLFHYVMSELPVLASAQPEHKMIIEPHHIGVCVNADQKDAYWNGLQQILAHYEEFKKNVISNKRHLCWENEKEQLLSLYRKIVLQYFTAFRLPKGLPPVQINSIGNQGFRECVRCVLNNQVDKDIYFNDQGLCNHCVSYDKITQTRKATAEAKKHRLENLLAQIKRDGKGKKYDCIIGVSGGLDSTYVAWLVKQFGLRPLAVHCDNGWNSELAVKNIENIINKLGIDLYTHVINWEEFRDLQLSYLKASVVDIEATSDHAIFASLYQASQKFGIKYIISGENQATEGMLPESWTYLKFDLLNIKAIHKQFGSKPLKTFPELGYVKKFFLENVMGVKYVRILDYVNYIKKDAKEKMMQELGWRDYGGKHYESIITRFYQSYILPVKFGIDKRYSHYSTLICSGQMTKAEAKQLLAQPAIDEKQAQEDKNYILKKFGLSAEAFEKIMKAPVKKHTDYPNLPANLRRFKKPIALAKAIFNLPSENPYAIRRTRSIAMLLDNPYTYDYRVIMEAQTLAKYYDVTLFAIKDPGLPEEEIKNGVRVKRIFSRDIKKFNNRRLLNEYAEIIARQGFEAIHCHDYLMLEIGRRIKQLNNNITLIYDAHELFHSWPLNFKGKLLPTIKTIISKKVSILNEKRNARFIDYLITVNQSLAENLKEYFNLDKQPLSLRNLQDSLPYTKGQHLLRKKLGIPESSKILVFIGAHVYFHSLNMKMILDQIAGRKDVALVFIAKADVNRKEVEDYAQSIKANNVYYHDIVPPTDIPQYLCDCDVGLVPTWNKKDLSYWYALDNKLFNYLLAGIPILATAQPEYKNIVESYEIGVCVNPDEPNAYCRGLDEILSKYDEYASHLPRAQKELNWETESQKLITFYQTVFS